MGAAIATVLGAGLVLHTRSEMRLLAVVLRVGWAVCVEVKRRTRRVFLMASDDESF